MVAEVSNPARQGSQKTFPSTVNGVLMGRVATARAGSTHRANSTINFAIENLLKFESFFCFYRDLREKIRVIYEERRVKRQRDDDI